MNIATHRALARGYISTASGALRRLIFAPLFVFLLIALVPGPARAQTQTGSIQGQVNILSGGVSAATIEVAARSDVMPRLRTTTTKVDGSFALPLLIPGLYRVTFTFADGSVRTAQKQVLLGQSAEIVLDYTAESIEEVTVVGDSSDDHPIER